MVSTISVERPESISWAPSEAKPTVSTGLDGGEILSSRGGPSRRDIISGNHTLPGH